jgi:dienelactone hydrolase
MDKKMYTRRNFVIQNSMIGTGALLGMDLGQPTHMNTQKKSEISSSRTSINKFSINRNRSMNSVPGPVLGKRIFTVPAYFEGPADLPEDIFGDLCLMRKGTASMTMGSGSTTIEKIVNRQEWEVKANALREIFKMTLGRPPQDINCSLSIKIESETDRGEILERRISYLLSPGERTSSLMLIPKGVQLPCPALLTIHPTTADGKEQTVGRGEKVDGKLTPAAYRRAYGLHLAQRGYITFSPDLISAGERIYPGKSSFDNQPLIDAYPEWSGTGKDIWDLQRALDVMQAMPEIDPDRIGSIGHSQGASRTCYLSALDKRVKVAVSNCGVWPDRIIKNPFHNSRTGWWTGQPALRPFCYCGKQLPIDSHELLALSAPRPYLNIVALNDSGFSVDDEDLTRPAWENLTMNIKKMYELFGAEDKFENILHMDGHDFHDSIRVKAFAFIDKYFKSI